MKVLAKASGIAYLLIFISGFYANFAILETLVDLSNSVQITFNIISNSIQFRNGVLGFLIMLVADVSFYIALTDAIVEPLANSVWYFILDKFWASKVLKKKKN